MKKFLAILCLICALCATLVFAGCDYSWQPPDYPDYVVDESGHHIANINRAAFIPEQDAPKTYVDVRDFGASPDASADDNTAAI